MLLLFVTRQAIGCQMFSMLALYTNLRILEYRHVGIKYRQKHISLSVRPLLSIRPYVRVLAVRSSIRLSVVDRPSVCVLDVHPLSVNARIYPEFSCYQFKKNSAYFSSRTQSCVNIAYIDKTHISVCPSVHPLLSIRPSVSLPVYYPAVHQGWKKS